MIREETRHDERKETGGTTCRDDRRHPLRRVLDREGQGAAMTNRMTRLVRPAGDRRQR
ncbi:hypothetical protein JWG42_11305 [Desulfoprunum benzoelyticum]|uniref:Uncharacterized protein n=1 Tax=Desulfoprunum benzoelyticum TaxID=1506996 RepID=A0A840UNH2_9BACT|nr:hypothetical protein [Desulfoprunum benzoelyticum]MBB5347322.1 hypothetical protein [Desulfoprunum benzoelyticum]MBM9530737.1 hypothetical protein [Desulfoprunum benzoelyticum]